MRRHRQRQTHTKQFLSPTPNTIIKGQAGHQVERGLAVNDSELENKMTQHAPKRSPEKTVRTFRAIIFNSNSIPDFHTTIWRRPSLKSL